MKNGMRVVLSLTQAIGVKWCITDLDNLVAGVILIPDNGLNKKETIYKKLEESKVWPVMTDCQTVTRCNFSEAFIEKEKKVSKFYKGTQSLLINPRVSFKSATLDKQYFLIKNIEEGEMTEEMVQNELKEQFFRKALQKLPLPIKPDWEKYIWDEIKIYFHELKVFGQSPYKTAFVMELPNVQHLQMLVEIAHKSDEFFKTYKRVPKLKSVLAVSDIKNFNFKDWQQCVTTIGGEEALTKLDYERQKSLVQAFEMFGPDSIVLNKIELWHSTAIKKAGIMLRRTEDKNEKAKIKSAFIKVFDMFKDEPLYINAIINNFEKIYKKEEQNIRNNNKAPIIKLLEEIQYDNIVIGAEELAAVCGKAKVSESSYKEYETKYLEHLQKILVSPKSYPTIRNKVGKNFEWELMDMSRPEAWVVGLETNCCMHLDSCGGSCLLYAAKNPETSGIFKVSENGRTIAQSFMWISQPDKEGHRILVMDNIEALGATLRDSLMDCYNDFATILEKYVKLFRIKQINIGNGCSDVKLENFCAKQATPKSLDYAQQPEGMGYTDSRTQWIYRVYDLNKKTEKNKG